MTSREQLDTAGHVGGLLLGLACGAVIGTAIGLLFAPAPGAKSRAWVAAQGRAAGRRVAQQLSRHEATDIVRRRGVRGLFAVLRGGAAAGSADAR
jgi:hypothetical protein